MSTCLNCRCDAPKKQTARKTFWTFCNIKTLIVLGVIIYWLADALIQ